MKQLVIWGNGGHAREVAQLVADIERAQPGSWSLCGFLVDPQAPVNNPAPLPGPLLGDQQWWSEHTDVWGVIAVGDPALRRQLVERLSAGAGARRFATLVHPRAWVAPSSRIGPGSVLFAGALLNVDVSVGRHASINLACSISHDCVLGDFVSLGPGVHLAGAVCVAAGTELGTGVNVLPRIRIGAGVRVGAGAVVTQDLPDGCTAVGVPARQA